MADNQIFGDSGNNNITGSDARDLIYGREGDDVVHGGGGNDTIYAAEGEDELFGDEGDDQLDGGVGADRMVGGIGNDTYYVDNDGDVVVELAGQGRDKVNASITYALKGNVEDLQLTGTGDIDGSGNELNNTIKGNSGSNSLDGRAGNDSIDAGAGDDIVRGGQGNDVMVGGSGIDTVSYMDSVNGVKVDLSITSNQNTVIGSFDASVSSGVDKISGFENLEGSQFADSLSGDAGNNQINGLGGGDTIRGRGGDDDLRGGLGADTFVFESTANNGLDRIRGFESGSDKLQFNAADGYTDSGLFAYDSTTHVLSYDGQDLAQFDAGADAALSDIVII